MLNFLLGVVAGRELSRNRGCGCRMDGRRTDDCGCRLEQSFERRDDRCGCFPEVRERGCGCDGRRGRF